MTTAFIPAAAAITALLLWVQYPLRKKGNLWVNAACLAVKAVLICAASLSVLTLDTWASWHLGLLVTAAYAALWADTLTGLISCLLRLIRKKAAPYKRTVLAAALVLIAVLAYGMGNEKHSVLKTCTVRSDKLTAPYSVVFVSDIHYGDPSEPDKLIADVARINALQPDIVILGGDITDDFTSLAEMQEAYRILSGLRSKTCFIFGNHDLQAHARLADGAQYTEAELLGQIEAAGITVLRDALIPLRDDILLLGREDASLPAGRKALADFAPHDAFLLIADHSPYDSEDIRLSGADLQLSGHSHAGQLFPNSLLMALLDYNVYGRYTFGETELIVSAGEGVWHTPFRTDAHSEILLVNLLPAE